MIRPDDLTLTALSQPKHPGVDPLTELLRRGARDLIAQAVEEGKRVEAHMLDQLDPGTRIGVARPSATIDDDHCL